ncbi:MAG: Lrp/AsnC family transcriptional regulator, partial [Bdellovibrionales bacterium]|nr:Lrp/AsnC family transcriptional regulator [Bdellovibrionales bacterium]
MVNETDRIILSELAKDSRVSYAKLGEAVNLSAPAVHARVKKLEESGVVSNYTIKVNPKGVDKIVCAFIRIGLGAVTCQDISDRLIEIPEIEECHSITGEDCLMAKVRT